MALILFQTSSFISPNMLHIAALVKRKVPRDEMQHSGNIPRMEESVRAYLEAFVRRTSELRTAAHFRQEDMAQALGLGRGTYSQYERAGDKRITILPAHLIPKFCSLVGTTVEYLVTGREHPVVAAYNAIQGEERMIVDKFLRLGHKPDDPLDDDPLENTSTLHDKGRDYTNR